MEANNFWDGITSLFNTLANKRSVEAANVVTSVSVSDQQLNEVYKTGIGNKIVKVFCNQVVINGNTLRNHAF